MPVYEYECKQCEVVFEEQRSIKEDSKESVCPKCKEKCKKIMSRSSFKLVGGGWFKDGY